MPKKSKSKNKGLSEVFSTLITTLIALGMIAMAFVLQDMRYLDIHEMVVEAGVERQAINLGQVLLSSPRLAYADGSFVHRGVFDKEKIAGQIKEGSDLTEEVGYPNSIVVIGVEDFKSGENWSVETYGPFNVEGMAFSDFATCMGSKVKIDYTMIFRVGVFPPGGALSVLNFWEFYDVGSCLSAEVSDYGSAVRTFPVAIKDGNDIHSGRLVVTVNEWT